MKSFSFSNGYSIPALGLGTWLSKPKEVGEAVKTAIAAGYRHLDCAYVYGNEKEIGEALKDALAENNLKREDVFITTKLWNSFHASEDVEQNLRISLADLQTDYIDLYLMHWSIAFRKGHDQPDEPNVILPPDKIPFSDTWRAMIALKDKGLVRNIGVSNFSATKLDRLIADTGITPAMNQVEVHPYFKQNDLLAYCKAKNILVTAYSPLGSSRLLKRGTPLYDEPILVEIAEKHSATPSQVMLAWGIERGYAVIPKSTNRERIIENFGALNVELDADDMAKISAIAHDERLSTGAYAMIEGSPYNSANLWD
ncbi:MAG: aldo/keto reductase [Paludibacter sp.]|jgi:alcohol dehydrogenase (NADP+)|nr:aldo/keto reductase [Paludibacter sp.]